MTSPAAALASRAIPAAFARRVSLTRAEVAETLGCSEDFVDSLVSDGKLRATKVRGLVFILAADVWALVGAGDGARPSSAEARSILRQVER